MANKIQIKHGSGVPGGGKLSSFELGYATQTGQLYISTTGSNILGITPASHSHAWSEVTSKPAQATRWPTWSEVTSKPAQATRWPTWSEVTSKPAVIVDLDLGSQVQMTSYRHSVIALCELTNTNPSLSSYSNGVLTFHRGNSLMGEVKIDIAMAKKYNTTQPNVTMSSLAVNEGVVPCTFTYNGVKYGGVRVFISEAEFGEVHFYGVSNFNIFGLDYYNTTPPTILNAEVNSSLNLNDYYYTGKLYFQNHEVWHADNAPTQAKRWPTWSEVTSKPSTFAPSTHAHTGTRTTGDYTDHSTKSGSIFLGPMNTAYNHILSSLNVPYWFDKDVKVADGKQVLHAGNYTSYTSPVNLYGTSVPSSLLPGQIYVRY